MGRIDPSDLRPQIFSIDIEVGKEKGQEGRGQIAINDRPYLIKRITHQIVSTDPNVSVQESQDGLYRIDWSLYEQVRFWKGSPPMADAAYGSIRHGVWRDLMVPVPLSGNQTLHVYITNEATRTENFIVNVQFHGAEDLTELRRKE